MPLRTGGVHVRHELDGAACTLPQRAGDHDGVRIGGLDRVVGGNQRLRVGRARPPIEVRLVRELVQPHAPPPFRRQATGEGGCGAGADRGGRAEQDQHRLHAPREHGGDYGIDLRLVAGGRVEADHLGTDRLDLVELVCPIRGAPSQNLVARCDAEPGNTAVGGRRRRRAVRDRCRALGGRDLAGKPVRLDRKGVSAVGQDRRVQGAAGAVLIRSRLIRPPDGAVDQELDLCHLRGGRSLSRRPVRRVGRPSRCST